MARKVKIRDIASGFIGWDAATVTKKMDRQMKEICTKYNLTIDRWEGNNDDDRAVCYFTPEIPEENADEFIDFVESLNT